MNAEANSNKDLKEKKNYCKSINVRMNRNKFSCSHFAQQIEPNWHEIEKKTRLKIKESKISTTKIVNKSKRNDWAIVQN